MSKKMLLMIVLQLLVNGIKSDVPLCYGAVFDAGSTSTKVSLFEWPCRQDNTYPMLKLNQTIELIS